MTHHSSGGYWVCKTLYACWRLCWHWGKVKNHFLPAKRQFFVRGFLPEGLSGAEGGIFDIINEDEVEVVVVVVGGSIHRLAPWH